MKFNKLKTKIISGILITFVVLLLVNLNDLCYSGQESSLFRKHSSTNRNNSNSQNQKINSQIFENQNKEVIKSKFDYYKYEMYKLSNGINVLIAQTEDVQKIGLAIGIKGLGSYQDPQDMQGLSHFTEHLLFTGSKNFQGNDEMMTQSALRGGLINGMTMSNKTLYPFAYNELKDLEFSLERYVDFVQNPLLKPEIVQNELYAVHSEYLMNQVQGTQQIYNAIQFFANKTHPFSNFMVGSVDSLSKVLKNPNDTAGKFIKKYYVPQNTYVTVITDTKIYDETKKMIEKNLLKLEEREAPKFEFEPSSRAFNSEVKGQYIKVDSKSDINEFSIVLILDVKNSSVTKSFDYILSVYTEMMTISFCSYMRKYYYATDCDFMYDSISDEETFFGVMMALTEKGLDFQFDISRLYFQYFNVVKKNIKNEELKSSIIEEQEYAFDYQSQSDVFSYVTDLGMSFLQTQNEKVLSESYDYTKVDDKEVDYILDQIHPKNAFFVLRSNFTSTEDESQKNNFQQADQNEDDQLAKLVEFLGSNDNLTQDLKVWGFKLANYKLSEKEQELLSSKLTNLRERVEIRNIDNSITGHQQNTDSSTQGQQQNTDNSAISQEQLQTALKKQNMISNILLKSNKNMKKNQLKKSTKQLSVQQKLTEHVKSSKKKPILLQTLHHINLWYLQDNEIQPNFAFISILFADPAIEASLVSQLYTELLADYLNNYFDAGIFYATEKGLSLIFFGETDQLLGLVIDVIQQGLSEQININQEKYSYILQRAKNSIYRKRETIALEEVIDWMKGSLKMDFLSDEKRLSLLNSDQISREDFLYWVNRFRRRFNVELFLGGSIDKFRSRQFLDDFDDELTFIRIPDYEQEHLGYYDIKNEKTTFAYRKYLETYDLNNFAIINYYQIGDITDLKSYKISQIIGQFFQAYSFYYLRSVEQLGYIAHAGLMSVGGQMTGMIVYIQGNRHNTNELNEFIEKVFMSVYKELQKLPRNTDFDQMLDFRSARNSKAYGLGEYLDSYWYLILNNKLDPNEETDDNSDNALQSIKVTKRDVLNQFKKWFKDQSAKVSFQGENKYQTKEMNDQVLNESQTFCFSEETLFEHESQMKSMWHETFYKYPVKRKVHK